MFNRRHVMIKKLIAAALSAALTLGLLTGCGSQIKGHEAKVIDNADASSSADQQQVTNNQIKPLYDSNAEKNFSIDYLKADNVKFYFEKMVVAGDSIADGWQYYSIIPKNRSIAYGGLSTYGFSAWKYDTTGQELGMEQTLKQVNPVLLYICLGMNDVNINSKETFAAQYKELLQKIKKIVPDCLVVVQSITPVAKNNQYKQVNNSSVQAYNKALKEVVFSMGREDIIYFNAYNSLLDENGMLDSKYEAGDGLHINTEAYKKLLEDLSKRLNQELAKQRIEAVEEQRGSNN